MTSPKKTRTTPNVVAISDKRWLLVADDIRAWVLNNLEDDGALIFNERLIAKLTRNVGFEKEIGQLLHELVQSNQAQLVLIGQTTHLMLAPVVEQATVFAAFAPMSLPTTKPVTDLERPEASVAPQAPDLRAPGALTTAYENEELALKARIRTLAKLDLESEKQVFWKVLIAFEAIAAAVIVRQIILDYLVR